jgi:hypothetical protein
MFLFFGRRPASQVSNRQQLLVAAVQQRTMDVCMVNSEKWPDSVTWILGFTDSRLFMLTLASYANRR